MSNLDHRSFRNISSSKYSSNGRTTKENEETTRYCTIISSFFVDVAHEMIICDNNDVSGEET